MIQVLIKKNLTMRPEVSLPAIYFESQTPLQQFQDVIEPQWGFRPDAFTNAYALQRNEICILDKAAF